MNGSPNLPDGIAVIGMAGRFPKARNIEEFWQNLRNGVEAISFFSDQELEEAGAAFPKGNPNYVKARALLEDAEMFDAAFFGINRKEAEIMDPQHRVFLECAWEALENAGYADEDKARITGVFAGMSMNTYLLSNLVTHPELMELVGSYQIMLANDKDYLPTRVSYKLNLRGPSVNIQTACSTSLVSVCVACQHLLNFQCDVALAGGVSVSFPQKKGHLYQEGGITSSDGHCRAFDAKAQGTVAGDACGVVVLKRLAEALADGDQILAVLKGFATNNDGSAKIGYTAPSEDGQAEAIALAQALAGVEPDSISYIVTHGTGTPLGDPIEIAGLTKAFRAGTDKKQFCALTSVKASIGHSDAAAGIAGLISAVLALHHKEIPPSLHYETPNPKIDFASSPFYVNAKLQSWNGSGLPRRAGVSSFGIGGTNAHVVLEEAPAEEPKMPEAGKPQLFVLSAKTSSALDNATQNLAAFLARNPSIDLADAAFTLQTGRKPFPHRRATVAADLKEACEALRTKDPKTVWTGHCTRDNPPVAFLFPGQGAQQVNMGLELYEHEPLFREQIDLCCDLLKPHLGCDLRSILFPRPEALDEAKKALTQTQFTQPALFVIEYAMARLLNSWGIRPEAMLGHSIGEYVAACLANVFTLENALGLVAARGRLMQSLPSGTMLAVRLTADDVRPFLSQDISLAAVNGASLCVLSGPTPAIDKLREELQGKGVVCQALHTSHAFHSKMMEPILRPFTELVRKAHPQPPETPFVSNVTGDWIKAQEAISPAYWARHLRETVQFAGGTGTLLKNSEMLLLEVGPGQTLSTLSRQHPARTQQQNVIATMRPVQSQQSETASLLKAVGQLFLAGVPVEWKELHKHRKTRRVALPTYPFERQRYFVEPGRPAAQANAAKSGALESSPASEATPHVRTAETVLQATPDKFGPELIVTLLKSLFALLSGLEVSELDGAATFTEMGFDSLFLTQACQAIEKKFGVKVAFGQLLEKFPTLDLLATHVFQNVPRDGTAQFTPALVDNKPMLKQPTPTAKNTDEVVQVPLTEAQKEVWYAVQKGDEAATAFNQGNVLNIRGNLDVAALRKAIQMLMERHEALRTTFAESGDYQQVNPRLPLDIPVVDLAALGEPERMAQVDAIFHRESNTPFNLQSGPLCRFRVIKMGDEHFLLTTTVHHLICDGTSLGVFLTELSEVYAALRKGVAPELPPAPGFGDYALTQAGQKDSPLRKASEEYWVNQFATLPPLLDLPTDSLRPAEKTFKGGWVVKSIRPGLCRNLKRLSAQHGCTLFTTFLAGYYVLLHRLTGQNEIVVGIPATERSGEGSERLMGHTVNFLPLRTKVAPDASFLDWLATLKRQFFDAFDHLACTYGNIVQRLNLPRDRSRMPLVGASFNMVWVRSGLVFPGLEVELHPNPHVHANFDLTFNITETEGLFILDCNYNADLIQAETAERWIGYFEKLLESISQSPEARINDLGMIPLAERQKVLTDWNRSILDFARDKCVHQLFEEQAARTAGSIAVASASRMISYGDLNLRSNQLAHFLLSKGIGTELPVALLCQRTPETIALMLAILKAGGSCVPLDPAFQPEQIETILDQGDIQMLLSEKATAFALDGVKVISTEREQERIAACPRTNPTVQPSPENAAFILYEDSILGKTKGVVLEHRNIVAMLSGARALFSEEELSGVAACTVFTRSEFLFELFAPLASGGKAILLDELRQILVPPVKEQVRLLSTTPAAIRALLQANNLPASVRTVNLHGEILASKAVDLVYERSSVQKVNHIYSAPEMAGFGTCASRTSGGPAVLGRAVANNQAYLLDGQLQPVPLGAAGELCLSGEHLGRGYHRNEALTKERFVPHPFRKEAGARLHRTGDLCRFLPDGNLVYVGRMARAALVGGNCVHPESIETMLSEHPGVLQTSVLAGSMPGEPEPGIVAYVVPQQNMNLTESELRQFLKTRIQEQWMPRTFMIVSELPMRPNGRPDHAAFPTQAQKVEEKPVDAQMTPLQETLAGMWQDVIGIDDVGIHDNFFDLGGHSVLVTQIVARIRKNLNVNLSLRSVFDHPTIAELAAVIEDVLPAEADTMNRVEPRKSELLRKE